MPGLDLGQVEGILERLESRSLVVAPELCTRQRHRRSTCTRCVDVCPVGAITWNEGLVIDWEVCTGCGMCAAVCPTAALEARGPSNDELTVQIQRVIRDQDWVAIACPQAQERVEGSAPCITVRCLGRLDESLLVGAAAHGAQAVWLVDGACQDCPQAAGRALAETVVARANALLEAFEVSARAAFLHDLPVGSGEGEVGRGSAEGVSRRGLFKALARETARVGETRAETMRGDQGEQEAPAGAGGDLPQELPSSRLLLLAALKRLGAPVVTALDHRASGAFAQFQLGEGCTGCQMCAFFCPTGALTRVVEDNRVGLAFRTSHCVNCGLCRDICYRDAVLLSPVVDLNKVAGLSVDWCFAQEMDAEPWKRGLGEEAAKQILERLGI